MDNVEIFEYVNEDEYSYYDKDKYLVKCIDRDTFDKVTIGGVEIQLAVKYQKNGLHKNPVRAMIVKSNKSSEFKEGDELICTYDTFVDPTHLTDKADLTIDGEKYYVIKNRNIICKVNSDGNIIPRQGVLICEPIYEKLISTTLELSGGLKGRRRDLVKVIQTYEGSKATVGDYLLTKMGGDYEFYTNGLLHIAVDEYYEDYYAIVKDEYWYDSSGVRLEMDLNKTINF